MVRNTLPEYLVTPAIREIANELQLDLFRKERNGDVYYVVEDYEKGHKIALGFIAEVWLGKYEPTTADQSLFS